MFGFEKIKELEKRLSMQEQKCEQLHRIIQYAKDDEPTYNLRLVTNSVLKQREGIPYYDPEHNMYIDMYINKEEYSVHLKELDPFDKKLPTPDKRVLSVDGNVAYYQLQYSGYDDLFIIDYKEGTYIYTCRMLSIE